jgi:hypothetical protein
MEKLPRNHSIIIFLKALRVKNIYTNKKETSVLCFTATACAILFAFYYFEAL